MHFVNLQPWSSEVLERLLLVDLNFELRRERLDLFRVEALVNDDFVLE